MNVTTATETVNQSTPKFIGNTIAKVSGSFAMGAVYALITSGPALLTGGICAISTLFDRVIYGMLRGLVKKNVISLRTFVILQNTTSILTSTALIVTGIYLSILGPVPVVLIALNLLWALNNLRNALTSFPAGAQPPIAPQGAQPPGPPFAPPPYGQPPGLPSPSSPPPYDLTTDLPPYTSVSTLQPPPVGNLLAEKSYVASQNLLKPGEEFKLTSQEAATRALQIAKLALQAAQAPQATPVANLAAQLAVNAAKIALAEDKLLQKDGSLVYDRADAVRSAASQASQAAEIATGQTPQKDHKLVNIAQQIQARQSILAKTLPPGLEKTAAEAELVKAQQRLRHAQALHVRMLASKTM